MSRNGSDLFLKHAGCTHPIICGPMYPCSNPELVAAASQAGIMGVLQPLTLTYVNGFDFAEGVDRIQQLTDKPIGMNLLIEKSSSRYIERMRSWLDIALDKNIRFFISSLGKPDWVVKRVHEAGGVVYHDVTERHWADKALDCGVDGLIAVNNRAGGHAGAKTPQQLFDELASTGLPLVCAGGISTHRQYQQVLDMGYQAVQMGTRFIASVECNASDLYKRAIVNSTELDIVLSERITGVPVSVINTEHVKQRGLKPNAVERFLLNHPKLKHYMRMLLALKSMRQLRNSLTDSTLDYWQAGKSVDGIDQVLSVEAIVKLLTQDNVSI